MKIGCILKHDYKKTLEFTPILESTGDPRISLIRVVELRTCSRCLKIKKTEEIVPFQFITDDNE